VRPPGRGPWPVQRSCADSQPAATTGSVDTAGLPPKLTHLDLSYNKLTRASLGVHSLLELDLSYNMLTTLAVTGAAGTTRGRH
jgi:hypothetical protein